jgi:lactate permease
MPWSQTYDPLHHAGLSTAAAAFPLVVLLGLLAWHRVRAHYAALLGMLAAVSVAIGIIGMPAGMAVRAALFGAAYGLFPIGWIVVNVIFLYRLTSERGTFEQLQASIASITNDRRLQLLLIAFAFGAFFEGAAGFGTPVAVTGAMLIGLGFPPLEASALSLIANTAPVAFGALGTPIIALQGVTGLDLRDLSAMVGRQLPIFSVIIPIWLIGAYDGWRGIRETWPALLVTGISFAVTQFAVSNYHGPWLVDVISSLVSMAALVSYVRWRGRGRAPADGTATIRATGIRPWLPWIILSVLVFLWGIPEVKTALNAIFAPKIPVPGLDKLVLRVAPVVASSTPEPALFNLNLLSATGTAILLAALVTGRMLGYTAAELVRAYGKTLLVVRQSLLTIAAMLGLGYVSRYSGMDAILGLAFARTGAFYPFFGAMLGWLGVALTGSDTSSNVLFGNLQTITAHQVGVSPTLMAAANSSGGVMGKMIDAQSIVVASTATRWYGQESKILRYVFFHSLALAMLVGLLVLLQAYVPPFTRMVIR